MRRVSVPGVALLFLLLMGFSSSAVVQDTGGYADLLGLFEEFREFSQAERSRWLPSASPSRRPRPWRTRRSRIRPRR